MRAYFRFQTKLFLVNSIVLYLPKFVFYLPKHTSKSKYERREVSRLKMCFNYDNEDVMVRNRNFIIALCSVCWYLIITNNDAVWVGIWEIVINM